MAYVVVGKNEEELLFSEKPYYDRVLDKWVVDSKTLYELLPPKFAQSSIDFLFDVPVNYRHYIDSGIKLSKGTIEKMLGYKINISNGPILLD